MAEIEDQEDEGDDIKTQCYQKLSFTLKTHFNSVLEATTSNTGLRVLGVCDTQP